jgi:hypothetical protein
MKEEKLSTLGYMLFFCITEFYSKTPAKAYSYTKESESESKDAQFRKSYNLVLMNYITTTLRHREIKEEYWSAKIP